MSRFDVDRFEPPPDEEFLCCICQGVLDRAMETPCRHVFCRVCIEKWLENGENKTCPTCRSSVTPGDLCTTLPILNNLLNKLAPKCLNRKNGCQSSWTVETFDENHEKLCEHRTISCKYEKCGTELLAKNAIRHEEKCDYRPYVCKKLCGLTIIAKDKNTHACVPLLKETVEELKTKLEAAKEEVSQLQTRNAHLQGLLDQPGSSRTSEQSAPSWTNFPLESDEDRENSTSSIVDFLMTSPSDQNSPQQSERSRNAESSLTDSMVGFSESSDDEPPQTLRPITISSDSSGNYHTTSLTVRTTTNYSRAPSITESQSDLDSSSDSSTSLESPHAASPSSRSERSDGRQSYASDRDYSNSQHSPPSPESYQSAGSASSCERYSPVGSPQERRHDRKRTRVTSSGSSDSNSYREPVLKRSRGARYSDFGDNSPPNEFVTDSDDQGSDSADSTSESQYR